MSQYPYKPVTSQHFRLLTLLPGAASTPIQTTLRHVNILDKPSFDALSYAWGDENPSTDVQIYVDKVPFTIRHNLAQFLTRIRGSIASAQVIYADAICINQKDIGEKNHQVLLMSEIYTLAKKVLVWLGEHDPYSELVFGARLTDYAKYVPVVNIVRAVGVALTKTEKVDAWKELLSRPYWNRTWIIQEFLLARSVVVFCGPDTMSGEKIFTKPLQDYFARMIQKQRKEKGLDGIPRSLLLYFWKRNLKHHGLFGKGKPYISGTDIFELAFNFQYANSTNVLDHVFGLLALEDDSNRPPIKPNYDLSPQRLFIEICLLRLLISAKSTSRITDLGLSRVPMLFRGLKLTFDNAEEILDILFDSQAQTHNILVVATIAKAFDLFGLLKPERSQPILPQTKTSQAPQQIISTMREWQMTQKKNGNWYNLKSSQVHEPAGMIFLQLDEPIWSRYSILAKTAAAGNAANQANANNQMMQNQMNNMNNINSMNAININNMNINTMNFVNNPAMMGPAGGFGGGGA